MRKAHQYLTPLIIFSVLLSFLIFQMNNRKDKEVPPSSIHGSYKDEMNDFTSLSFDSNTSEYFYYDMHDKYQGNFEYLEEKLYKITSGKFKGLYVRLVDHNTLSIYDDNSERTFIRTGYNPTIINNEAVDGNSMASFICGIILKNNFLEGYIWILMILMILMIFIKL